MNLKINAISKYIQQKTKLFFADISKPKLELLFGLEIIAILFLSAFCISFSQIDNIYLWDEAVYLSTAQNLLSSNPYYTEIDYRPPLLPFLLKISSFFINIEIAAKLIISLFFSFGVLGIYLLASQVYGKKTGLVASVLFFASLFLQHSSGQIMTDLPSATLIIFCFYFLFKSDNENKSINFLYSAIFIGLAILMRFTSVVFFALVFAFLYIKKNNLKLIFRYFVFALIPMMPYLIWAQLTLNFALMPFIKAQFIFAGSGAVGGLFYYLNAIYIVGGIACLIGLALYIFNLKKFNKKKFIQKDLFFILWALFLMLYLTINPHKELRYIIPAIPAIFILASVGFCQFKDKYVNIFIAIVFCFAILFSFGNIAFFDGTQDIGEATMTNRSKAIYNASFYISKNIPEDRIIYSNSLYPVIAYYTKKKCIATWPWDETFYKKFPQNMPNNAWYIHFTDIDKEPNQEWLDSNEDFKKLKEIDNIIIYEYNQ